MSGYPALLWLSTAAALLGSVQFGAPVIRGLRTPPPAPRRRPCAAATRACRHPARPAARPRRPPGYHLGVLNTAEAHVEVDLGCGEQGAALVAFLLVGATLGSLGAGRLADRLGPRCGGVRRLQGWYCCCWGEKGSA